MRSTVFRRVLVANRGEIALRIIRTLREMGITSVAAFSDADRDARFVEEADEAYRLGPAPAAESYLSVEAILAVAEEARVDAIHPGYGFLAENAEFAQAVADSGQVFIGPSVESIRIMGDKVRAREAVAALGVPVVPGTDGVVNRLEEALAFGERYGYPVAVKAAGGGGGRGIRVVEAPDRMEEALERARREAGTYFRNPQVYLERYFARPRHVEIQVLADNLGNLVHLGERDCSVQRRHQKLIEESPSPALDRALRERMGNMALLAARSAHYTSVGTVEFLLSEDGEFYFLEMNTRIQVEHPVTEQVTGVDLIREMVLAAASEPISVRSNVLDLNGHAIEARVNAEDPAAGFRPTPARITRYLEPGGIGVRIDTGVYPGFTIPPEYDSLVAKVIAWGADRESARKRLLRALAEFRVEGPATTISFAEGVLSHPIFAAGEATTSFIGDHLAELAPPRLSAAVVASDGADSASRGQERVFDVEVNRHLFRVRVAELQTNRLAAARQPRQKKAAARVGAGVGPDLLSPMHGSVIVVKKRQGDKVEQGETLFIVEAMKMENEVAAHRAGTLKRIDVEVGQTVEADQRLAVIE